MAEKKTTTRKRKKGSKLGSTAKMFSKFEVLFIVVLFIGFFAWAFTKCSSSQLTPANVEAIPNTAEEIEEVASPAAANNPNSPTYDLGEVTEPVDRSTSVSAPAGAGNVEVVGRRNDSGTVTRRSYTPLYVTLQDLKVRRGPSRDSAIVSVLSLNEEVMFMEKRTSFRERINIGTELTNEPWVYVQTKKGHKGWVYGAGVHYFKWDRLKDPIPTIPEEEEAE